MHEHDSDVDIEELDSKVATGDRDIESDTNNTLEEESEIDDDERMVSVKYFLTFREAID